eukprot:5297892-Amphidinium_carterae.1
MWEVLSAAERQLPVEDRNNLQRCRVKLRELKVQVCSSPCREHVVEIAVCLEGTLECLLDATPAHGFCALLCTTLVSAFGPGLRLQWQLSFRWAVESRFIRRAGRDVFRGHFGSRVIVVPAVATATAASGGAQGKP